jgi:glyoxylase-like metal-dependent hydrolase (beta-lactamase superfamily II)
MGALKGAVIPVTAFQQNCTVLWDDGTKQGVVIDPGGDVDRILIWITPEVPRNCAIG